MNPNKRGVRSPQSGEEPGSYRQALVQMLESLDFEEARKAALALGESKDAAAIKPLVAVIKNSASLRSAAIAALKKIARENDAASTELAMAVMREKEGTEEIDADARLVGPADRRRCPRVLLRIRVLVQWRDEHGKSHSELTTTRIVNACGALLTLKRVVALGQELELTNLTTEVTARGRVVWLGGPDEEGKQQVGIELGNPDAEFWVGEP